MTIPPQNDERRDARFELLSTARLTLRRPRADDVGAVFRIHGDPRTNLHNPDGPQRDAGEAAEMLASWLAHWEEHRFGYWAVEDADARVIGFGGVMRLHREGRDVLNLYYRFEPGAWGRGYASELAAAAVRVARSLPGEAPLTARTRPANEPAKRVAERAGLVGRPGLDADGFAVFVLPPRAG